MRKMTLRAYVEMLRCEDRLREHPLYFDAAVLAVRVYLDLHDAPYGSKEREELDARAAGMTTSDYRKMLNKQKKAEAKGGAAPSGSGAAVATPAKKAKKGKKTKAKSTTGGGGGGAAAAAVAEEKKGDSKGEALVKTKEPLVEAAKFLSPLLELAPNRLLTQVLAFEVALRKKKTLQMLRALRRAVVIAPTDADTLRLTILFLHFFEAAGESLHASVKEVAKSEMAAILGPSPTSAAALQKVGWNPGRFGVQRCFVAVLFAYT